MESEPQDSDAGKTSAGTTCEFRYSNGMRYMLVYWLVLALFVVVIGALIAYYGDGWLVRLTGVALIVVGLAGFRELLRIRALARETYKVGPEGLTSIDERGVSRHVAWQEVAEIRFHVFMTTYEIQDHSGNVRLRAYHGRGGPKGLLSECVRWTGVRAKRRIVL
jgi:hypothetical protein